MKTVRYLMLFITTAALVFLSLGTALEIVEFVGLTNALQFVWQDPSVLVDAYYESLGSMRMNFEWFGYNGPFVMLGLLFALLVACLP